MSDKKSEKIRRAKEHNESYIANKILNLECCSGHSRNFKETYNSRYSRSKHAPSCDNYFTKKYKLITTAGNHSFIFTEERFYKLNTAVTNPRIRVEDVFLTDDQLENIDIPKGR